MADQFNVIGKWRADWVSAYDPPVYSTNFLFKYLRLDGATSGSDDMITTGGTTGSPDVFSWVCPANRRAYIRRCNISAQDDAFPPAQYGNSTIANGVIWEAYDTNTSSRLLDFTDGEPITQTGEYGHLAGVDVITQSGTGPKNDDHLNVRWTIAKAGGNLVLTSGQAFRAKLQDDMSHLTHHDAMIQGVIYSTT